MAKTQLATLLLMIPALLFGLDPSEGLVVERVEQGGGGAEMGLKEGDIVWGWRHQSEPVTKNPSKGSIAEEGVLSTPFDLRELDTSKAPSGETRLKVRRAGKETELKMSSRDLGVSVRPPFKEWQLDLYQSGRNHLDSAQYLLGLEEFGQLASCLFSHDYAIEGAWVLQEIAKNQAMSENWADAKQTFELALDKVKLLDPDLAAHILETQGDLYERFNLYEEARQCFQDALAIRRRFDSNRSLALSHTYDRLGHLAYLPGDFSEAYNFYQESLDIRGRYGNNNLSYAQVLNNMGKVAMDSGSRDEAEGYFRRAYDIAVRTAPASPAYYDAIQSLGTLAVSDGENARARQFLGQALKASQPDSLTQAQTLKSLGDSALKDLAPDTALPFYVQAERIVAQKAPNSLEHAEIYYALGDVHRHQKAFSSAESYLKKGLAITTKTVPDKPIHARLLNALGNLKRDQGRAQESLAYYDRALDVIESVPADFFGNQEQQASFSAKYRLFYRDHIGSLISLGRYEQAFDISEKYRARALLASISDRMLALTSGDRRRLREVRTSLNQMRKQLLASPVSDNLINALNDPYNPHFEALKKESTELETKLSKVKSLPDLRPLTRKDIGHLLKPGTCLVSYLVTENELHLFAITRGKSYGYTVANPQLAQKVSDFRRYLMSPNSPTAEKRMKELSQSLGDLLLKPIAAHLKDSDQLVILPDGPLHALPFSALTLPGGDSYLAETHTLTIADSATTYHQLQKQRAHQAQEGLRWLGFGPPKTVADLADFKRVLEQTRLGTNLSIRRAMQNDPLPYSELEVEQVADFFAPSSQVLKGLTSSERNVRSLAMDVDILHFACHGVFNSENPEASALLLAPNSKTDKEDDGSLTAHEIANLNLTASLVVLSACESGLGRDQGGEGAMSIARAFRLAGAKSVVASLWRVSDFSTTLLMKSFYTYLLQGHSTANALTLAQRDLIKSTGKEKDLAHPFYWAAFQLLGTDLTQEKSS